MLTAVFAREILERNEAILLGAVEGLSLDDLHWQPGPESNSIAWLLWHLSRTQDNHRSAMDLTPHVWVAEGWHARFGRSADPADRGRGHTAEEVTAFRVPDLDTLLGYHTAVRARTDAFLSRATEEDLERQAPDVMGSGTVPAHHRLQMMLVDNIQHSGQVAYLRGLLKGRGWLAA